ncbi:penicillin-binding protein 1A [Eikenella corrodens]|uniref:Penicillin-binding protein 1A n=1 Tax=Eikenella corrodens TaxID=539 RepID=A0A3S9SJ30_EIKCO|nr:penicillin-binding protein 1A [Eikenella corrodens]AZR59551.1 penicillin-binding protein 1A [Eikenella corrodens]
MFRKILKTVFGLLLGLTLFGVGLLAIAVLVTYPKLPSLETVTNYQPRMPLTIYSSDGKLIGMYGEERRAFTKIDEFPPVLINAVIAAEDKRFYQHWGVDVTGVARALIGNFRAGGVQSGASTITQQVARNFYLTNERSYRRKFNEALLAYKIEQSLSKQQILELYFNQIYLGQRAYGFAAASQIYFNKPVKELTLAEATILAGLPKAPSSFNPIVNPERARLRQRYILNNMVEEKMITPAERDQALAEELHYRRQQVEIDQNSLYVAEMVRQEMYDRYGEDAYTQGFRVYTTVSSESQRVATLALRRALKGFGLGAYRGAEAFIDLNTIEAETLDENLDQYLDTVYTVDGLQPAVVLQASRSSIEAYTQGGNRIKISGNALNYVARTINNGKDNAIRPGAVIRVRKLDRGWQISQMPELQGAFVALDSKTGAIRALVGGFDFHSKSFNRATQAERQPGSTFKPFVYSAALAKGMTAATTINDAPIELPGMGTGGRPWRPKNSDGRYSGFITLRQALTASKNMVSIRIVMALGIHEVHQYVQRFGFNARQIPDSLSMALGSGVVTPLQMAQAYAVFANGGYKVSPYVIDRIEDSQGRLRAQMKPLVAGESAPQVIDPRNAYIMYTIMQDVVRRGTGARASALGRSDIAGKTGTTNENKDAWFAGFNPDLVGVVYIGFDKPRSMGRAGFGGTIALPVWVEYMRYALKGVPQKGMPMPAKIVRKGGEYFLQEQQSTSPRLAIDNRGATPDAEDIQAAGGDPVIPEENTVEPVPQQNSGDGGAAPSQEIDALF